MGQGVGRRLAGTSGARRLGPEGLEAWELPGFLDPDECAAFMRLVEAERVPSPVFANRDDAEEGFRTSETCWLDPGHPLVAHVSRRIAALLGLPYAHSERLQGQRYAPGQRFAPHCDYFLTDRPYWPEERRRGGQRTWTAMVFLNAPERGGETAFPRAGFSVVPEPGKLLAWSNLDREGEPNPLSLHEGRQVEAGLKYILTLWFRERPCRKPGLAAALRRAVGRAKSFVARRGGRGGR